MVEASLINGTEEGEELQKKIFYTQEDNNSLEDKNDQSFDVEEISNSMLMVIEFQYEGHDECELSE